MDITNPTREPTPERRRASISRLRALTAGVAVVGIAGTTGFALLAANGYTGASAIADPITPDATSVPFPGLDGGEGQPGFDQQPDTNGLGSNQLPGTVGQAPSGSTVLPPSVGRGPGHVSTGGS